MLDIGNRKGAIDSRKNPSAKNHALKQSKMVPPDKKRRWIAASEVGFNTCMVVELTLVMSPLQMVHTVPTFSTARKRHLGWTGAPHAHPLLNVHTSSRHTKQASKFGIAARVASGRFSSFGATGMLAKTHRAVLRAQMRLATGPANPPNTRGVGSLHDRSRSQALY